MKRKGKLTPILGIILFLLGIAPSESLTITREMVVKLGQSFTLWQYERREKQTQFRVTFEQLLFEGEKSFGSYESPPAGKKYVKVAFSFENMGPRPGTRAPDIGGELKADKGHIFPEKPYYLVKIQKWADPGEKGSGHLIFLIPVDEVPVR